MKAHRNWKSLPAEILGEIFCLLDCRYHTVHVCKAWMIPAQIELYSNVMFKTLPQLQKFYSTVEHNSYLGNTVRKLDHDFGDFLLRLNEEFRESTAAEITNLLESLLNSYLPNLEDIYDSIAEDAVFGVRSYTPILNALQNSQLKHLRRLYLPLSLSEFELETYAACAELMRDRLENLGIDEESNNRQLYNNLHRFNKLKELNIANDRGVESMEYIVANCKSLHRLAMVYYEYPEDPASFNMISNFTPVYNIKSLEIYILDRNHHILFYIMHKFPNLDHLHLELCGNILFDREMFTRLLKFSSTVGHFNGYGILMDFHEMVKAMGDIYDATSRLGLDTLRFDFSDRSLKEGNCFFNYKNGKNRLGTTIVLRGSVLDLDWKCTNYLEKNGKYVGTVWLKFLTKDTPQLVKCELPENILTRVFTYCPNLHSLVFTNCVLKRPTYTSTSLPKANLIKNLSLTDCFIYPGVLEQLSLSLPKLERLFIHGEFLYHLHKTESPELDFLYENSKIEINMPNTEIDTILFDEKYYDKVVYIKVLTTSKDKDFNYYTFNKHIETSNEEEYTAANNSLHVYICCQNKPKLVFKNTS